MGTFFTPFCLGILLIGVSLEETQAVCVDKSSLADMAKAKLPTGQVLWWCTNNDYRLPEGDRVVESFCPDEDELETTETCSVVNADTTDPNLGTDCAAVTPPDGSKVMEDLPTDLPDYVRPFVCEDDKVWLSGSPSTFSQCIKGNWSPVFDICDEDCPIPRDCSMVSEMGYNVSGVYQIIPTGDRYGDPIRVWCDLSDDPDEDGWTTVLKFGQSGLLFQDDPMINNYFIGAEHMVALNYNDSVVRPMVFQFLMENDDTESYHATYTGVEIEKDNPWTLRAVGDYHGNAGNAFINNVGNDFVYQSSVFWWHSPPGGEVYMTNAYVRWKSIQPNNMKEMTLRVRPLDFDAKFSCPPAIGYEPEWEETTTVNMSPNRSKNSIIEYSCNGYMFMEGREDAAIADKTPSGTVTCRENPDNNVLEWSRDPVFPCRLACLDHYVKKEDETACIRFSNETAKFGITTASLECSRENASLATMTGGQNDLQHGTEGNYYYTAHVRIGTQGAEPDGPLEADIPCESSSCSLTEDLQCLSVSTGPTNLTNSQKPQSCEDADTYYTCMMPPICPNGFKEHHGLCYQVVSFVQSNFLEALKECRKKGSVLAYPESLEALEFIRGLVAEEALFYGDNNVFLGLNDVGYGWGGVVGYNPNDSVITMAGVSSDFKEVYRYMTINHGTRDNFTLVPSRLDATDVDFKFAACQLHGQEGCSTKPPPVTDNMYREWDNSTSLGTEATYKCFPGYYMNDTVGLNEQVFTCLGQLGEWLPEESAIFNCTLLDVCLMDDLPCSESSLTEIVPHDGFLALNGTIDYTCYRGMAMAGTGQTEMNSTCTENPTTPRSFAFDPPIIPECNVCIRDPNVDDATSPWDSDTEYIIGTKVKITCNPGYMTDADDGENMTREIEVMCNNHGWDWLPHCFPVCELPLPVAGVNMTVQDDFSRRVGSTVNYTCAPGLVIPSLSPDMVDTVFIECGEDGNWTSPINETELYCAKVCELDPVAPPIPGNTTWDGSTRVAGTEVNLTCPDGQAFVDENTTLTISCGDDGSWTKVDTYNLVCRMLTYDLPQAPNGSEYSGPLEPYWERTEVSFFCPDDLMSKDGKNITSFTFNGTEWLPLNPEFACFNVCGEPPQAEEPVTFNYTGIGIEGDTAFYECLGGFEGDDRNITSSTCLEKKWNPETIPVCKMCVDDPPTPPLRVEKTPEDGLATWGTIVSYTCNGKYPDGTKTLNVTCDAGNWTHDEIPTCEGKCLYFKTEIVY